MKKIIITTLILLTISIGIYIMQVTVGFPPSDATGSAIKGVQKEMLQDKDINEFINTVAEAGLDTSKLGDYKVLVKNKEFIKLYNTNTFSTLAKFAK